MIESIEKNLISYPEMVNLLEFINIHDKVIKNGCVNGETNGIENKVKPFSFNYDDDFSKDEKKIQ